jgi:hypothetical protein
MRFDEQRSIYRDCRWCQGGGCLYCKAEADKAYKVAFPDGPQPIATFAATPEGFEMARKAIGADALRKAFGAGGDGISEIMKNIQDAAPTEEVGGQR